jgi:hypothetical protein
VDGGGREADFSATPFANARTASVEMTVLRLKRREKRQTPAKGTQRIKGKEADKRKNEVATQRRGCG